MKPPSAHWNSVAQANAEIHKAIQIINFESLCEIAFELRKTPCTINRRRCAYGGVNILFELEFADCFWIARIRRPDEVYPTEGTDSVMESEVTTMRFVYNNTNIPVPAIYGYDAHFGSQNKVGMPYILMEAMPGRRLYGGGRADFIPDGHKIKVYQQTVDFIVQLYQLEFSEIGMLFADNNIPSGIRVGPIHDQNYRISPYGPFTNALDFYHSRWELLSKYHHSNGLAGQEPPLPSHIIVDEEMPGALQSLVYQRSINGPFRLVHPDFQISNFLFDDEYAITGLVDWSGCQTVPLESFARHPSKIIPDPDEFLDFWGDLLSPDMRSQWGKRREMFLRVLKERVGKDHELYNMMLSRRAYFANCLDFDGILCIRRWLPRKDFERFVREDVL
jgi:isoamyl acetate esterase